MKSSFTPKPKLEDTGTTIFTVMSKLSQEYGAINLGQGFPDFDTDPLLLELVAKYTAEGKNQYSPLAGLPVLLDAIANKIARSYGQKLDPSTQICVTAGATQALYTAIMALVHPQDEVIVIEPAYDCYKPQIELAGGIPVAYQLRYPDYQIDWDELEKLVNSKTRMIVIHTPQPNGDDFVNG